MNDTALTFRPAPPLTPAAAFFANHGDVESWTVVDFESAVVLTETGAWTDSGPVPVPLPQPKPATAHAGDSDPNLDEALRRAKSRPARADVDTLIARIDEWRQEQIDAAYTERAEQLNAAIAYELTLAGWSA